MPAGAHLADRLGTAQRACTVGGKESGITKGVRRLNWQSILEVIMKYWVQQLCTLILCLITW